MLQISAFNSPAFKYATRYDYELQWKRCCNRHFNEVVQSRSHNWQPGDNSIKENDKQQETVNKGFCCVIHQNVKLTLKIFNVSISTGYKLQSYIWHHVLCILQKQVEMNNGIDRPSHTWNWQLYTSNSWLTTGCLVTNWSCEETHRTTYNLDSKFQWSSSHLALALCHLGYPATSLHLWPFAASRGHIIFCHKPTFASGFQQKTPTADYGFI